VKSLRLDRWTASVIVASLFCTAGPALAERPDVLWMRGGHAHSATTVQYSPDGSIIASGGDDGTIKLWRAADGMLLRTLTGHQAPPPQYQAVATIRSLSFSLDGTLLASAGNDNSVLVWSVADGSVVRTLSGAFPARWGASASAASRSRRTACADNTTTVTESNETNNCRASVTTIQVTVP